MAPTKKSAARSGSAAARSPHAAAGRNTAKKASAKKASAKKASAKKAGAKKATAKKASAKATAKKAGAKKATARTASAPKRAARAAKKAVEPVTRAAGAAKRATRSARSGAKTLDPGGQRDAIDVLTEDHRSVEDLFARFERTGDGAHQERQELVDRITKALSVHASIEEEIFYPAARRGVADADDDVLEALEEHHLVKVTLAELQTMQPGHERYGAKVTVLIENVRHHVEEEEGELFPRVRAALGEAQLREIGEELVAAQSTAPTQPHPEAPDTPPGNIVAQVLTAPFDAAASVNKAAARRVREIVT